MERPAGESCPPGPQIRALLLGRGTATATDHLARHISGCARCAAVAESIALGSSIASGFRREDLPPPPTDRELADVVARISQIDRLSRAERPSPALSSVEVPARLGPYRPIELLGAGGMGAVYRAEDTALHRFVAVKVIRGSADADARARFLSEARALAAVRHDNIVTIHFVGEEPTSNGSVSYLAMELLEGQSLRDWMATAPQPSIDWIVHAGRQIAAGLAFVHDAGMVHRDVKPANLWLETPAGGSSRLSGTHLSPASAGNPIGRIKLLDFGLAHEPGHRIETGAAGTPAYAAPEQARGEVVDGRADLFALGCVLYELCSGRLPFPGRSRLWTGWDPAPVPVRTLNSAVPERLARLIERLLAADRADRPASAQEVELELASFDPTAPRPLAASAVIEARGERTIVSPSRRGPLAVALLGSIAMVLLLGLALRNGRRPDPSSIVDETPAPMEETEDQAALRRTRPPGSAGPEPRGTKASGESLDDDWRRAVAAQPPQLQLNSVLQMLGGLNPKFDWLTGSGWVEQYGVIRITIDADTVSDLRPVEVLKDLTVVRCRGSAPGLGLVTDVTPLSQLHLKEFHCRNNPHLGDLSSIRLESLEFLDASYTGLQTLEGLAAAPIVTLKVAGTAVTDLGPLRQMPKLRSLDCTDCPIADFEPLAATSLRELRANIQIERDAAALQSLKTLETINRIPVKDFWKGLRSGH